MRLLSLMLICFTLIRLYAQQPFNYAYDLGAHAVAFSSIESLGDTIVMYGVIVEGSPPATHLLFCRMDTLGNVIDYQTYRDSLGREFTRPFQNSMIKLSDGSGFAAVGQFFDPQDGYFVKYNNVGTVTRFVDYPDSVYGFNAFVEVEETSDGFYIIGSDVKNFARAFLKKVSQTGAPLWERKYFDSSMSNFASGLLILEPNELVFSAHKVTSIGTPLPERKHTSWIFGLDSMGIMKWSWESEPSLDEIGVGHLRVTDDGTWFYTGLKGRYNKEFNEISVQPIFVFRDSNFNLLRVDTFGKADTPNFGFSNLLRLSNGDWLTIGVKPVTYDISPKPLPGFYNSLSGWIARFDHDGNEIWSVVDTAFWSETFGSENYLYDVIELASGSIVVCGYSRTRDSGVKDWGWLIKLDKNGCIDTLFCGMVGLEQILEMHSTLEVKVYPNPAAESARFDISGGRAHTLYIYDTLGRLINTIGLTGGDTYYWNCQDLPSGAYYYAVISEGKIHTTGNIFHN